MSYVLMIGFLIGCGGSLTEEQRKQMKEASEQQVIKKVSEADLLTEAINKGREIMSQLNNKMLAEDSIEAKYKVKVVWLKPGAANATEIESQLIDAYLNSLLMGEELTDNIQQLGTDSLLYTKPIVEELENGSVEVKGTWNIRMSKKQLILAMDSK